MWIFGQWDRRGANLIGYKVINDRYQFYHWNDKNEWHNDGEHLVTDQRTKFYIQLFF